MTFGAIVTHGQHGLARRPAPAAGHGSAEWCVLFSESFIASHCRLLLSPVLAHETCREGSQDAGRSSLCPITGFAPLARERQRAPSP